MSTTPLDLLRLARDLAGRADEAALRSATSRAYYAAHHQCDALCTQVGISLARYRWTRKHEEIIDALERYTYSDANRQQELRTVGTLLRQCRDLRNRADYDLNSAYDSEAAEITIATVESMFALATSSV